jgi:hypothetical protein
MEHAEGRVVFDSDRALFDVPPEIAYFNTANLSPHLHAVREAGEAALRSAAGRGRSARRTGSPTWNACGNCSRA